MKQQIGKKRFQQEKNIQEQQNTSQSHSNSIFNLIRAKFLDYNLKNRYKKVHQQIIIDFILLAFHFVDVK